jgi:hypothetical protein
MGFVKPEHNYTIETIVNWWVLATAPSDRNGNIQYGENLRKTANPYPSLISLCLSSILPHKSLPLQSLPLVSLSDLLLLRDQRKYSIPIRQIRIYKINYNMLRVDRANLKIIVNIFVEL